MNKKYETMLLKPDEAARQMAISQRTLWQLTNDGELPCVRIRRMVRYDMADITAYIESKKNKVIDLINPSKRGTCVVKGV